MSRFDRVGTPISGLYIVERRRMEDERGFLERLYCADELVASGLKPIRQINRTLTRQRGAARGMHLQRPPAAEMKLVTCLSGAVFDVALDLRQGSESFGRWFGVELDGTGRRSLLIPEGCAHGFQTLEPDCTMLYLHTADYSPENERGVNLASAGIDWPLAISETSLRDAALPGLDEVEL